jgi:protein-disulfide isomerase
MSKEIKILGAIIIVVVVGAIIGTSYYRNSSEIQQNKSTNNSKGTRSKDEALVRPDSPTLGAADAKVTIVEFLDPECEACSAFNPIVKQTLKDYEGKVRLVVRYMPLHPNSLTAATFLEAAGDQGKYWEAQELLFQKQPEWGTKHGQPPSASQPDINTLFRKYATELGLDLDKMDSAFAQNKYFTKIERDKNDGQSLGVRQTPTIFVNGKKLTRLDEMGLRYLIDVELKK